MNWYDKRSAAKPTTRQRIKKAAGVMVSVLLWAVLALSLLLVVFSVLSHLKNNKGVGFLGLSLYQIVSGSMEPELKVGDVLLGKSVDYKDLRVGQNLIFYDQSRDIVIAHKIIELSEDFVTTHGIANPDGANETVLESNILAVQVFKIPGLGNVLNFLRTPAGFFLVIFLPIGGIILFQSLNLKRQLKQYRAKNAASDGDSEQLKTEIAELKRTLKKSEIKNTVGKNDSNKNELSDGNKKQEKK